jgi:hypothetical protein
MKIRIITAVAISGILCHTSCGHDSNEIADLKSPSLTTTSTTSVSNTTEPQTTTTATTAESVQPTAPSVDYSPNDLAGEWVETDAFNNILTVNDDGSFSLKYAGGGTRLGKIKVESEEQPDGSFTYRYSFYEDDGTIWAGFVCPEKSFNEIYSEANGGMSFVRNNSNIPLAPTIPEAKDLRDALDFTDKLMCGVGVATDSNTEYTTDDGTVYHKSVDNIYKTTSDIRNYLYHYMTEQFISSNYDYILGTEHPKCIDIEGELYIEYRPIGGRYCFENVDPTIDKTDNGYTINIKNNDYGAEETVVIDVVKEDGCWKINEVHDSF